MTIYVPQHLRKLGVIKNLCDMIQVYSNNYEETAGSFDDYQIYMKLDPVKRFVDLCLNSSGIRNTEIINYVTRLFHSVRGTYKVFEYMKIYLGLSFNVSYTTKELNLVLDRYLGDDISIFNEYLLEFLEHLVYYESLDYNVINSSIEIDDTLDFGCGIKAVTYKIYRL
jgi:hypothetical protein